MLGIILVPLVQKPDTTITLTFLQWPRLCVRFHSHTPDCAFHALNYQRIPSLAKDLEKSYPDLIQSFGFVYIADLRLESFVVSIGSISSAHLLFSEKIHSLLSDSDSLGRYLEDKVIGRVCPGVQKTSMTKPKILYAMPSPPPAT